MHSHPHGYLPAILGVSRSHIDPCDHFGISTRTGFRRLNCSVMRFGDSGEVTLLINHMHDGLIHLLDCEPHGVKVIIGHCIPVK